ncbi:MAG: ABC transporter ATP-binding protein [Acidobacteriia bacterium]|nr:ABC transporter ATP-binding protein [Terriglobia bacterium]
MVDVGTKEIGRMIGRGLADGALDVEGVSFRFPHFELAPTSFAARPGEVVAIIGPNGSGKSTLLEIVSGHLRPLAGRVTLDGDNIHELSPRQRAQRIGLARQEAILLFSFQVREFVRQGRHPHLGRSLFETSEDERWVDWALARTNLAGFAKRRVLEISSGEFQRAVLARTLAQRPRLLLLDEPTANLDIGYQIEMLRLIRNLAASENFIAVVVTHELNLAAELADALLLLEDGRCLTQGRPEEVLRSDVLSRVFRTPVVVDQNPKSGRPRVTWVAP